MRNKIGRPVLGLTLHEYGLGGYVEARGKRSKPIINSRKSKKALLRKEM